MFSEQKKYSDAEANLQRSRWIRGNILGARHSDVAPALESLGWVYFFDSKYIEAEPLFQRSLQIWTATKEPTNPLIAQALDALGSVYSAQKRYTDAGTVFQEGAGDSLDERSGESFESGATNEALKDMKRSDDYFSGRF